LLGYDISIIEQNKLRWTVNLQLEESRKSLELRTSIDQAYRLGIFRNEQVVINPEIMEKCCKIMRGSVEPNENALVTLRSLTDFIQPFDGTAIGEEVVAAAALILGHQPTYVNGEWGFNLELVGF
jgi:hypothetical protein